MAVNPYFNPATYFFSGEYDDLVLSDFFVHSSNESYSRVKLTQERLSHTNEWTGNVATDLKVDKGINDKYGFTRGTLSILIKDKVLKLINRVKFAKKFGKLYGTPVSLMNIASNPQIFENRVFVQIGDYRITDAYVTMTHLGYTIITFPIALDASLLSGKWIIWTEENSSILEIESTISHIKQSEESPEGDLLVSVPKTAYVLNYGTELPNTNTYNSWDIEIPYNLTSYGDILKYHTVCYLSEISANEFVFTVPKKFIYSIVDPGGVTKVKIQFIHRVYRRQCIHFDSTSGNDSIFELGYVNNPSAQKNIQVYEYDNEKSAMLRRFSTSDIGFYAFPDIYNFTTIQAMCNNDLLIEVYEYPITKDIFKFDNNGIDLIENVGYDNYVQMLSEDLIPSFRSYNPYIVENANIDYYLASQYKGDIRGFILNELDSLMKSDPYEFVEYRKYIDQVHNLLMLHYNSPNGLKIGPNYPEYIDNSHVKRTRNESTYTFSEYMRMIHYRTVKEASPCMLYINGSLVIPAYEYNNHVDDYIFIPSAFLSSQMSRYVNHNEEEMKLASPISLDIFNHASRVAPLQQNVKFSSLEDSYTLFENYNVYGITLADIQFYNTSTGEEYDISNFIFELEVDELTLNTFTESEIKYLLRKGSTIYFMTNQNEAFYTIMGNPILLGINSTKINPDDYDTVYPLGIKSLLHADLDLHNIHVSLRNNDLLEQNITISTTNRLLHHRYTGADLDEYQSVQVLRTFGELSPARYEVYLNGTLLNSNQYSADISSRVAAPSRFTIYNAITVNPTDVIDIIHTPIKFRTQEINLSDLIKGPNFLSDDYTGDGTALTWEGDSVTVNLSGLTDILNWDKTRVFLNGIRISTPNCNKYKTINILHLTEDELACKMEYLNYFGEQIQDDIDWSEAKLIIKYPERDQSIITTLKTSMENEVLRSIV